MRLLAVIVLLIVLYAILAIDRTEADYTYEPPGVITVEELPPIREENE